MKIDRIPSHSMGGGRHEMEWVDACKQSPDNRKNPCSSFDYAGPLTEMVLMGNLAIRLQNLNSILEWNRDKMEFTNIDPRQNIDVITTHQYKKVEGKPKFITKTKEINTLESANEWIRHTYRYGWGWG